MSKAEQHAVLIQTYVTLALCGGPLPCSRLSDGFAPAALRMMLEFTI